MTPEPEIKTKLFKISGVLSWLFFFHQYIPVTLGTQLNSPETLLDLQPPMTFPLHRMFLRVFYHSHPQRPLFFWSAPRTWTLATAKARSPQIMDSLLCILRNLKQSRSSTVTTLYHYCNCTCFCLWPESGFLVLTKRKADSEDENVLFCDPQFVNFLEFAIYLTERCCGWYQWPRGS